MKIKSKLNSVVSLVLALLMMISGAVISMPMTAFADADEVPFSYDFVDIGREDGQKAMRIQFYKPLQGVDSDKIEVEFPVQKKLNIDGENNLIVDFSNIDPSREQYTLTLEVGALNFGSSFNQLADYELAFTQHDIMPGYNSAFGADAADVEENILENNSLSEVELKVKGSKVKNITTTYQSGSTTLTNVDIEAAADVARIVVIVKDGDGNEVSTKDQTSADQNFHFGFAGLVAEGVAYNTLTIDAYDADGKKMESKTYTLAKPDEGMSKSDYIEKVVTKGSKTLSDIMKMTQEEKQTFFDEYNLSELDDLEVFYPNMKNVETVSTPNRLSIAAAKDGVDTITFGNDIKVDGITTVIKCKDIDSDGSVDNMYVNGAGNTFEGTLQLGTEADDNTIYVRNLTVDGSVVVDAGTNGEVYIDESSITGTITVKSGGVNSVHLNDTTMANLEINSTTPVRVVLEGSSAVTGGTAVKSGNAVTIENETSQASAAGTISVEYAGADVTLAKGDFTDVSLTEENVTLTVKDGVKMNNVDVDKDGATVEIESGAEVVEVDDSDLGEGESVDQTGDTTGTDGEEGSSSSNAESYVVYMSGTAASGTSESAIKAGGETIVLRVDGNARWDADGEIAAAIAKSIAPYSGETFKADDNSTLEKGDYALSNSDTVLTIMLPALAGYTTTGEVEVKLSVLGASENETGLAGVVEGVDTSKDPVEVVDAELSASQQALKFTVSDSPDAGTLGDVEADLAWNSDAEVVKATISSIPAVAGLQYTVNGGDTWVSTNEATSIVVPIVDPNVSIAVREASVGGIGTTVDHTIATTATGEATEKETIAIALIKGMAKNSDASTLTTTILDLVTGVTSTEANLDEYKAAVAAAKEADADTAVEIVVLVAAGDLVAAIDVIEAYATADDADSMTDTELQAAGATTITANLADYQTAVAAVTAAEVDTTAEIQAIVDGVDAAAATPTVEAYEALALDTDANIAIAVLSKEGAKEDSTAAVAALSEGDAKTALEARIAAKDTAIDTAATVTTVEVADGTVNKAHASTTTATPVMKNAAGVELDTAVSATYSWTVTAVAQGETDTTVTATKDMLVITDNTIKTVTATVTNEAAGVDAGDNWIIQAEISQTGPVTATVSGTATVTAVTP